MLNIKSSGQCPSLPTSHYSSTLASLDAMLHTPAFGHQRAFRVRRQLAYCSEFSGPVDVFEPLTPVPVHIKRTVRVNSGS